MRHHPYSKPRYFYWLIRSALMGVTAFLTAHLHAAQTDTDAPVLRQNWQEWQHRLQQQQTEEKQRTLQQSLTPPTAAPSAGVSAESAATCLKWQQMSVSGLERLGDKQRRSVQAAIPTSCISSEKLNQLSHLIAEMFLQQGYFKIKLSASEQDKRLIWHIAPAKVGEVRNPTTLRTANLLPGIVGKDLNIRDLDQAIGQANRLQGHRINLDIYPQPDGNVALAFSDQPDGDIHGSLSVNNKGQSDTGRVQIGASVQVDNPTHSADSLSLYAQSTPSKGSHPYSRNVGLYYSLPYGYWTFSASGATSAYASQFSLNSGTEVTQSGDSWQGGVRGEYVFSRAQQHISSTYAQLSRLDVKNRFMDSLLRLSSYDLTSASLGINHIQLLANGNLSLNLEYQQGLSILGADKNPDDSDLPQPQFHKITAAADWTHYLPTRQPIRLQHSFYLQYGFDHLPSIEKLGLTDHYAVRGFDKLNLSADSGAYLRQTLSSSRQVKGLTVSPYLGLDIGSGRDRSEHNWRSGIGAALGVNVSHKQWSGDVSVSKGRLFGHALPEKSEPARLWLEARWRF